MLHLSDVLLLGNPRLRDRCEPVTRNDLTEVTEIIPGLHNIISEFRAKYQAGRAIAAPQVGYMKRLVYMYIDHPVVFINPRFTFLSEEKFTLWDDCMSFPQLFVQLARHRFCTLEYFDLNFEKHEWHLSDGLAELMQHEIDHLDGILAIDRALDKEAFRWKN